MIIEEINLDIYRKMLGNPQIKKLSKEDLLLVLEELQPFEDSMIDNLKIISIRESIEISIKELKGKEADIARILPLGQIDFVLSVLSVKGNLGKVSRAAKLKLKMKATLDYYRELIRFDNNPNQKP